MPTKSVDFQSNNKNSLINPRLTKRILEVKQAKRRRFKKKLLAFFVSVAFLSFCLWVLFGPITQAKVIKISSTGPYSRAEILKAAGLSSHPNLISINVGEVKNSLEKLPFVNNALVNISIPDSVTITLSYRSPIAYWAFQNSYFEIDSTGRVLKILKTEPNLLKITGINTRLRLGGWLAKKYDFLLAVARAVVFDHFNYVNEVDLSSSLAVKLYLKPSGTVLLGFSGQLNQKLLALNTLYNQGKLTGGQTVDLTVPQMPVIYPS